MIYGKMMESVSDKALHGEQVKASDDVKDNGRRTNHAWIVLIRFNPLPSTNPPRYLEGDSAVQTVLNQNGREADVEYVHTMFRERSSEFGGQTVLNPKTLQEYF